MTTRPRAEDLTLPEPARSLLASPQLSDMKGPGDQVVHEVDELLRKRLVE